MDHSCGWALMGTGGLPTHGSCPAGAAQRALHLLLLPLLLACETVYECLRSEHLPASLAAD